MPDILLSPRYVVLAVFTASVLYVHFRGKVRLPFLRQLFNHSSILAPVNALLYLFSAVPPRPFLDPRGTPELALFRTHWQEIRDEALQLSSQGHIQAALKNNDAGFNSFFKEGWKRFYLKWYDEPLPSAQLLCPRTVALVNQVPGVKAAMFTLLPAGAHLNPHRDPFAGSLRYHLGLVTPNADSCHIVVDGESYSWRDGEDVLFDETFVHWAENRSDQDRLIFFCDVERPLRPHWLGGLNRLVGGVLGRATATQNLPSDRVGVVNRLYGGVHWMKQLARRIKQFNRPLYKVLKLGLILGLLYLLFLR
ncbi:MAG: aspartyl beta-hydroxylase [Betaproteobacteria bacterium HGW-Betaproteobacteria-3]|jgi:beta-hydroxylase|nr:MAG: aspartyl beta-hydroxylase [Betaproteobacteria bacterium HGW-Betaproteobacteria-3]